MTEVTQLLQAIEDGEPQATERLVPLLYEELRKLAAGQMSRERPGQTLQATALVHEAYLRLLGSEGRGWQNKRHFLGAAAEAMRRILIESARRKQRVKHGGKLQRVELDDRDLATTMRSDDLVALDEAMHELERVDPDAAELVKLRFFVGLTQAQAAGILGVSPRTAGSMWALAKAWLYRAIRPDETDA